MFNTRLKYVLISSLVVLAACGGDKTKDDAAAKPPVASSISPDDYRSKQQAFADSVLGTAKPVAKVVETLGKGYAVGPTSLRDTLASLAANTTCYKTGRATDPYLAGTVSIFAHMAPIGVDLIQVQRNETKWTSAAGELVNACLDTEMKKWKLDMRYGKPAAYIVQVQFKTDTTQIAKPDTATPAKPKGRAPAAKKA